MSDTQPNINGAQTRTLDGALREHQTVAAAFEYAAEDGNVWKVSFNLPGGGRARFVRHEDTDGEVAWIWEPIVLPEGPRTV